MGPIEERAANARIHLDGLVDALAYQLRQPADARGRGLTREQLENARAAATEAQAALGRAMQALE